MKQLMNRLFASVFIFVVFLTFCTNGLAPDRILSPISNLSSVAYAQVNTDYSYQINNYDINITVNENNTFNITEKIGAFFNTDKHGIFRKIPLKNEIVRMDGTKSYNNAKVSDIKVSDTYTITNQSGYKVIQIGDKNRTVTGLQEYTISYLYNIGKDPSKNYDEFYYNLIGTEWDTSIRNIKFTITMPKGFDRSKLGFSAGSQFSANSQNISYVVDGNKITGLYKNVLNPGEALTIRIQLPEGYFVDTSNNIDYTMLPILFLPIIFVIICFILWRKYGKDEKVIETVEFYPPEGLNSAEVGFVYKGTATSEGVISLIVYLANKGYIKISEIEEKGLFSKTKSFKLTKAKEYDGNNREEKTFLAGLFTNRDEVTANDLRDSFYTTTQKILSKMNSRENKCTIFEKSSLDKYIPVVIMMLATLILITFRPVMEQFQNLSVLLAALVFQGVGLFIIISGIFGTLPRSNTKIQNTNSANIYIGGVPVRSSSSGATNSKFTYILFGFLCGAFPWSFMVLPGLMQNSMYMLTYAVGIVCIAMMSISLKYMSKRTKYGNELLGKIRGFKNFLEYVEKPKLEALVMENPNYFYHILPYTYVLGISSKWIEKFETILCEPPNWYISNGMFNTVAFCVFMSSTMNLASSVMSAPVPSSSSSDTGGGFSDGGSGGGGGGSW